MLLLTLLESVHQQGCALLQVLCCLCVRHFVQLVIPFLLIVIALLTRAVVVVVVMVLVLMLMLMLVLMLLIIIIIIMLFLWNAAICHFFQLKDFLAFALLYTTFVVRAQRTKAPTSVWIVRLDVPLRGFFLCYCVLLSYL